MCYNYRMAKPEFRTEDLLEAAFLSHPLFSVLSPEIRGTYLQQAESILDRADSLARYYDHQPTWREVLDDLTPQFKAWTKTLLQASEGSVSRGNGLSLRLEAVFYARRTKTSPDELSERFTHKKKIQIIRGTLPQTSGIRRSSKRGAFNS